MTYASIEDARRLKPKASEIFRRFGPVTGVGVTKVGGSYAVKVNFRDAPTSSAEIPTSIDGVPVVYEVVGKISAR